MRQPVRTFVLALVLISGLALDPALVAGADPQASGSAATVIPALLAPGSVVTPSGRILPPVPRSVQERSVMSEMLAQHENDRIAFTPGARPMPATQPASGLTTLAPSGTGSAVLLPLAPVATNAPTMQLASLPNHLHKQVFGFLPYWKLSASDLQWMQYGLVSTIAYFGVAARSNGSLATTSTGWTGWNSSAMTGVINAAHAKGDKVVLTITMMAWDSSSAAAQATLLGSSTYRAALVNNIIATIRARNADGVNLDFEPVATTQRDRYTSFVRQLKAALVAAGVGSNLTVCTTAGAATWSTGYDVAHLTASGAADAIFVMGYDYSWSGSSRAGGVAPMESPYMLDVNQSLNDFLDETSGSKLIWGVPYYGRTWRTTSGSLNAATVSGASGSSRAYEYTGALALARQYGRLWDGVGQVPWFRHYDNSVPTWVEGYYDDQVSLGAKYDMINRRGLAGAGVWHLLMDEGSSALWNLISAKLQNDTSPPTGGITNLPVQTDAYAVPVAWHAVDPGSGVVRYSVQARDRASSTWSSWLTATTATSGTYLGTPGHAYEFRVSATDGKGNVQPWLPAALEPGASLAVGGFARVLLPLLNVRAGAGTGFVVLDQVSAGAIVRLLAGPLSGSGYSWYQVQFAFPEWPSADYPRTGWVAAGDANGPYLAPRQAPNVTQLAPRIGSYTIGARFISPNGDGVSDSTWAHYALAAAASSVRLDVVNAAGTVIRSTDLGPQAVGAHRAGWDGRLPGGAPAPSSTYLLRIIATDAAGTHAAPSGTVNPTILARWGVAIDLTAPAVVSAGPTGRSMAADVVPAARFSEPVVGISGSTVTLTDLTTGGPVAATVAYDAATRGATLQPAARLAGGHTYRVHLAGVRDRAGNPLPVTSFAFVTTPRVAIYATPVQIVFAAGTTTGYKFDASGTILGTRTETLPRASGASASTRSTIIPGHPGGWYLIVNGMWAGYWVRESATVYHPGISYRLDFYPAKRAGFTAGTYTGYRFDSSGRIAATRRYTLPRASGAATGSWAIINGRPHLAILNGLWAGYWIPVATGISLG